MDEMKIMSGFTSSIFSKVIHTVIRKKYGYNIDIHLNQITATVTNGKTCLHLDVNAELEKEELLKLLKNIGI